MKRSAKPRQKRFASVRQSVTIPVKLATQVRRVAREKHLTVSRALVVLAERGLQAEAAERENLNAAYRRFMSENEPERKSEAGKELIRVVFGKDAIAEDSIL